MEGGYVLTNRPLSEIPMAKFEWEKDSGYSSFRKQGNLMSQL